VSLTVLFLLRSSLSADDELRDEGGRRLGLVAATKKEVPFEQHGIESTPT